MSASPASSSDNVAGSVVLQHIESTSQSLQLTYLCESRIIEFGATFDLGRREFESFWQIQAPTISVHHLRFHCILFDSANRSDVAALVYVRVLSCNAVVLSTSICAEPRRIALNAESGNVLLSHGDILKLSPEISISYKDAYGEVASKKALTDLQKQECSHFAKQYRVTSRVIGSGGLAHVFLAWKAHIGRQMACKAVPRRGLSGTISFVGSADEKLMREYAVLKHLNHPNIIRLDKVLCTPYNIYIFQELITGGDLFSHVSEHGQLSEPVALGIVRQLLEAIAYLHENRVVHRDIKPENILLTSPSHGARVVLTDFGQACESVEIGNGKDISRMRSVVGTSGYQAPEILNCHRAGTLSKEGYTPQVDIWSVGCVTATLLTGELLFPLETNPFPDSTEPPQPIPNQHHQDVRAKMEHSASWTGISSIAKQFILQCVSLSPLQRLSAAEALLHPWLTNQAYATGLNEVYERAVHEWRVGDRQECVVEYIDTTSVLQSLTTLGEQSGRRVIETKS